MIILLVASNAHLQTPMYFLLSNLSLSEVVFTTNIVPNMLQNLLSQDGSISFSRCLPQYYVFSSTATAECLLLAIMSYDRYLAICSPLHYASLINFQVCQYAAWAWLAGFTISAITLILLCESNFCGPNMIDIFFLWSHASHRAVMFRHNHNRSWIIFICNSSGITPICFIIVTYIFILYNIIKIPSPTGRKKAFSTCSSHPAVVSTYYGTLIAMYVAPLRQQIFNFSKALSLLYTVVTPLLNPFVYSLWNQEIHNALTMLLKKIKHFAKTLV